MSSNLQKPPPVPPSSRGNISSQNLFPGRFEQVPSITQSFFGESPSRGRNQNHILILASFVLHLLALSAFGLVALTNPQLVEELFTTITNSEEPEPIVEHTLTPVDEHTAIEQDEILNQSSSSELQFESKGPISFNFGDSAPQIMPNSSDLPGISEIQIGNEVSGRMSLKGKQLMIERFGGNPASEAAVAAGLKWLSNHQLADGGWSFAHSKHPDCKGQCSQDGIFKKSRTGATGMALLAFLGAGHTHFAGDYQPQIKRALDFLHKSGKRSRVGFDLRGAEYGIDGNYVQGLCTIALCECAAMTRDNRLRKDAQGAVDLIVNSQNPDDGGWRYRLGEPGDTSVLGWQVMALKSAQNAKLDVSYTAFKGAERFLDSAQTDRGSQYVYVPNSNRRSNDPKDSMTAVGLLCRMYLGWDRSNTRLASGVNYLAELKPSREDMYFNYYATQVMHHWGGEEWRHWNEVMRDFLVTTQHPERSGHHAGSWDIADPHGNAGGRLYMTCLCVMTLEVYYRHLPLYHRENLKVEF